MDIFGIKGTEFIDLFGGSDSDLWLKLFVEADKINPDLASRLMHMRNGGCCLQKNDKFGYVIVPVLGEWEKQGLSYDVEKKCLIPYRDKIVQLMRYLSRLKK
jgi:hypothetical protein